MSDIKAPWMEPVFLQDIGTSNHYGYQHNGNIIVCSKEELIEKINTPSLNIIYIVTPNFSHIQILHEVDEFADASHQQMRAQAKDELKSNLINGAIISFIIYQHMRALFYVVIAMYMIPILKNCWCIILKKPDKQWRINQSKNIRFRNWIAPRKNGKWKIIGILIILSGIQQIIFGLNPSIGIGGLLKENVRNGEYWRILTCTFLHGNIIHFIFNMMALASLSAILEKIYRFESLIITYVLACIAGSLASCFFSPFANSVGASGGILGLLGFLLGCSIKFRNFIPKDFFWAFLNPAMYIIIMGFAAKDVIDNAAHAGGFFMGFFLAFILQNHEEFVENQISNVKKTISASCLLLLVTSFIILTYKIVLIK
ncbi:MAG: hypothetical protein COA79_04875 [Planctomycetota bacterium]|nr:MAG: hypothetical protein COA79_04875 [Planctomycetota bacterium]